MENVTKYRVKVKRKMEGAEMEIITYAEAAKLLGMSKTKVWMLVRDGEIVPVKLPGSRRASGLLRKEVERIKADVIEEYEAGVAKLKEEKSEGVQ